MCFPESKESIDTAPDGQQSGRAAMKRISSLDFVDVDFTSLDTYSRKHSINTQVWIMKTKNKINFMR